MTGRLFLTLLLILFVVPLRTAEPSLGGKGRNACTDPETAGPRSSLFCGSGPVETSAAPESPVRSHAKARPAPAVTRSDNDQPPTTRPTKRRTEQRKAHKSGTPAQPR